MSNNINILDYKTLDLSRIYFDDPQKIKGGSYMSLAYYNNSNNENKNLIPLIVQTPRLQVDGGINKTETRCSLELNFDKSHWPFYEFVSGLDEHNIVYIQNNSKKWFSKKFPLDIVEEFYKSPIKPAKNKTPPKLKLKIPLVRGNIDCNVYNNKNELITHQNVLDEEKTVVILRLLGLRFLKQQVICEWQPIQIKVFKETNLNNKFQGYLINDSLLSDDEGDNFKDILNIDIKDTENTRENIEHTENIRELENNTENIQELENNTENIQESENTTENIENSPESENIEYTTENIENSPESENIENNTENKENIDIIDENINENIDENKSNLDEEILSNIEGNKNNLKLSNEEIQENREESIDNNNTIESNENPEVISMDISSNSSLSNANQSDDDLDLILELDDLDEFDIENNESIKNLNSSINKVNVKSELEDVKKELEKYKSNNIEKDQIIINLKNKFTEVLNNINI